MKVEVDAPATPVGGCASMCVPPMIEPDMYVFGQAPPAALAKSPPVVDCTHEPEVSPVVMCSVSALRSPPPSDPWVIVKLESTIVEVTLLAPPAWPIWKYPGHSLYVPPVPDPLTQADPVDTPPVNEGFVTVDIVGFVGLGVDITIFVPAVRPPRPEEPRPDTEAREFAASVFPTAP